MTDTSDNIIAFDPKRRSVVYEITAYLVAGVGQDIDALIREISRRWPNATEQQITTALLLAETECRRLADAERSEAYALEVYRKDSARRSGSTEATLGVMCAFAAARLLGWHEDEIPLLTGISGVALEEFARSNLLSREDERKVRAAFEARQGEIITHIQWAAQTIGATVTFDFGFGGAAA